jgi:hypothetical protein
MSKHLMDMFGIVPEVMMWSAALYFPLSVKYLVHCTTRTLFSLRVYRFHAVTPPRTTRDSDIIRPES